MGLDLGTVRGEEGQKGVAPQGGPRPTTGETGLPADVSSHCQREGRRCWGSLLAGWPANSGVYSYLYQFNPLPHLTPRPPSTHAGSLAGLQAAQPPPRSQLGGDSVPGAGAAPSGQEGGAGFLRGSWPRLAPGSHSHPGFVCQAQAAPGLSRLPRPQPASVCPDLPCEVRSWGGGPHRYTS